MYNRMSHLIIFWSLFLLSFIFCSFISLNLHTSCIRCFNFVFCAQVLGNSQQFFMTAIKIVHLYSFDPLVSFGSMLSFHRAYMTTKQKMKLAHTHIQFWLHFNNIFQWIAIPFNSFPLKIETSFFHYFFSLSLSTTDNVRTQINSNEIKLRYWKIDNSRALYTYTEVLIKCVKIYWVLGLGIHQHQYQHQQNTVIWGSVRDAFQFKILSRYMSWIKFCCFHSMKHSPGPFRSKNSDLQFEVKNFADIFLRNRKNGTASSKIKIAKWSRKTLPTIIHLEPHKIFPTYGWFDQSQIPCIRNQHTHTHTCEH